MMMRMVLVVVLEVQVVVVVLVLVLEVQLVVVVMVVVVEVPVLVVTSWLLVCERACSCCSRSLKPSPVIADTPQT